MIAANRAWVRLKSIAGSWSGVSLALVALGAAGVMLALVTTGRYGPGLSQDLVDYVMAARSLLAGKGYLGTEGLPFLYWPPLFPTLLALLGLLGIDPLQGGRLLNALSFGLIIFASGQLSLLNLRSKPLAILGAVAAFGYPILYVSTYVWSESLFALLALAFLIQLSLLIEKPHRMGWAWLAVLGALACLQRYIGNVLIVLGCLVIVASLYRMPLLKRLFWAALFLVASMAPVGGWMLRTYWVSGYLTGDRGTPDLPALSTLLAGVYRTVGEWFPPAATPVWVGVVGGAMTVVVVVGGWTLTHRGAAEDQVGAGDVPRDAGLAWARAVVPVGFAWLYLGWLIYASVTTLVADMGDRLLAPIYVPVMLVALILVDRFAAWAAGRLPQRKSGLAQTAIVVLTALAFVFTLQHSYVFVRAGLTDGIEGYASKEAVKSPIMKWVRQNGLRGNLYSNDPWLPSLVTGEFVHRLPGDPPAVAELLAGLPAERDSYLIWFSNNRRRSTSVLDAFISSGKARLLKETSDGYVYHLER